MRHMIKLLFALSKIQDHMKDFQEFKTQYTPRTCNASAHSIAKLASKKIDSFVWLDTIIL